MYGAVESGRVAIVTGSTGGLGQAIAHRLAADGTHVVATDTQGTACEDLADKLPGGPHLALTLDVSDEQAWTTVLDRVATELGGLHVLINNAGIGSLRTVESESRRRWDAVVAVDQLGAWLGMKYGGPCIERSGGGAIVNISSVLGTVGGSGDGFAYAAAKGALRTMTKNAALHWAQRNVRVNSVHPSYIETPQLTEYYAGTPRHQAMLDSTPMGRLGKPEEVAGAVAFLVSADATFITGSELYVDGGWTAR